MRRVCLGRSDRDRDSIGIARNVARDSGWNTKHDGGATVICVVLRVMSSAIAK